MAKERVAASKNASAAKTAPKPKVSSKAAPALHPPYLQMVKEAILALKERTGSSTPAIAKFIEEKYKSSLPPNFKRILSVQIRKFAKSEKLVKVKNSYKVAAPGKATKKVETEAKAKKVVKTPAVKAKPVKKVAGEKRKASDPKAAPAKEKAKSAVSKLKEVKKKVKPLTLKKVAKTIKKSPKGVAKRAKKT